ncbi:MAG: AIPR family protein [Terracidiphilus sp.]
MNLRQQLIQDRTEAISDALRIPKDISFLRLAHSFITGQSIHAFDQADLVDGGQDKQIDTITIDQKDEEASVYIISAKNTDSFSSNAIIQMRNGLDWAFNKPKADLATLSNTKFRDRVMELRSVLSGVGYSNVEISVVFVTNGLTSELSDEFKQEEKHILDSYNNGTFASFSFEPWGADELINRMNALEKRNKKIDASIPIRYDANNPSLIKYHAEGLKGLVCSTSAREIAKLVIQDATGSIFDANIRRFLGVRGTVNSDIFKTCTDMNFSYQFWFLNNGITVICDSFDPVTDPDNPHIKLKGMQIVNGCQTASALALAEKSGRLAPDARVLLRIYETTDPQLLDKIVLTTNNQNKISSRDLKSNDKVQVDMQDGFLKYKYYYERKINQYGAGVPVNRIIVNETVAQSYLAIVLKKPSDARRRKYKVWGELYDSIFSGQVIEVYVLATQIYRLTSALLETTGLINDADDLRRKIANNGAFHVARIVAYLWRGSDKWKVDTSSLKKEIDAIEENTENFAQALQKSFLMLEKMIRSKPHYAADIDAALKSGALETDLDKELHANTSI